MSTLASTLEGRGFISSAPPLDLLDVVVVSRLTDSRSTNDGQVTLASLLGDLLEVGRVAEERERGLRFFVSAGGRTEGKMMRNVPHLERGCSLTGVQLSHVARVLHQARNEAQLVSRLFAQDHASKAAEGTHHGDEDDLRVGRLGHILESVERSDRHGGGGRQDVGG